MPGFLFLGILGRFGYLPGARSNPSNYERASGGAKLKLALRRHTAGNAPAAAIVCRPCRQRSSARAAAPTSGRTSRRRHAAHAGGRAGGNAPQIDHWQRVLRRQAQSASVPISPVTAICSITGATHDCITIATPGPAPQCRVPIVARLHMICGRYLAHGLLARTLAQSDRLRLLRARVAGTRSRFCVDDES